MLKLSSPPKTRKIRTQEYFDRRKFLSGSVALLGAATADGWAPAWARQLSLTPPQVEGPYFPTAVPLDFDNNLASVEGRQFPAEGQLTHIGGRVLDQDDRPVMGAKVEIWQCNAFGRYMHPRDTRDAPLDPNFQGYGQMVTGSDGTYRFRTIKPVPYSFRAPHIHFAISGPGFARLVTQMYIKGEPRNEGDRLLNRVRDTKLRQSLIVELNPTPAIEMGSLGGVFDIVLRRDNRFQHR